MLPRQLRPARTALSFKNVPYAYATIKDKCWAADGMNAKRCCDQPSHSCLRVICSFFHLTCRAQLRYVSRAVRFLLQVCWRTFEIWDLSRAPQVFKSKIAKLEQHNVSETCPNGLCLLCSAPLETPSVLVADAGQAYEVPEVSLISDAVDSLFVSADALDIPPAIYVMKGQKFCAGFGGSHKTPYQDRYVFYRKTLHRCISACLLLRIFTFGPLLLLQNYGIPTGGPHSTVLLSILLGRCEDVFVRFKWQRILKNIGETISFDKAIAALRYADDYCAVSRCVCVGIVSFGSSTLSTVTSSSLRSTMPFPFRLERYPFRTSICRSTLVSIGVVWATLIPTRSSWSLEIFQIKRKTASVFSFPTLRRFISNRGDLI